MANAIATARRNLRIAHAMEKLKSALDSSTKAKSPIAAAQAAVDVAVAKSELKKARKRHRSS